MRPGKVWDVKKISMNANAVSFTDTESHWSKEPVEQWAYYGILNGGSSLAVSDHHVKVPGAYELTKKSGKDVPAS